MRRTLNKYLTRVHKWAGLILAFQILAWFGSGFFMTLFPIDQVRGRHLVDQQVFSLTDEDLIPIEIAMTAYDGTLTGARLANIAGRPAYILLGGNGTVMLDARTGQGWDGVGEADIRQVAVSSYKGEGVISAMTKLDAAPKDYAGPLPVWQVRFDDRARTRLYIDPDTATIRSTRTRLWRVFDLAWKFHIMDVTGEDNFNSLWLRLASGAALLFALSGVGLLWFRLLGRPRRRNKAKLLS
ncbi:PepSY domain-containing protein [Litorimonas sp. WD9-15]|uniref:PepSY domain-containing protein n=1 Tax=Litorimonas sp. WD9-15 TaxID=3418716 RepID=UPI003D085922